MSVLNVERAGTPSRVIVQERRVISVTKSPCQLIINNLAPISDKSSVHVRSVTDPFACLVRDVVIHRPYSLEGSQVVIETENGENRTLIA